MKRSSGVLLHISSLWGDYGCGSFGKEAKLFVDFLKEGGFSYWQVLPFSIPDDVNSPYQSYSAFAGNPYFIDLPTLYGEGLITGEELANAKQKAPHTCEYDRLKQERLPLLFRAADRLTKRQPVYDFLREHPEIEKVARFMALKEQNGGKMWTEWDILTPDETLIYRWAFIQYTFFTQWDSVRSYANEQGISIIGDIPFYLALDSADVWANPEQFDLDDQYIPRHVAGVPPDYFAKDGQLWGNPLYRWDKMKEDGYTWWKRRIAHTLSLFDVVRIDHFRALDSYWEIPKGAKTAKEGKWKRGPGKSFIRAMQEIGGDHRIIAEDLGEITDSVRDLLAYSGYPGMRIFQFGFDGDPHNTNAPHNYPANCVVYTGTHDNTPLLSAVWDKGEGRQFMLEYCGYEGKEWDACYDTLIKYLMGTHANLVMLPIQDILHFGCDTRMNTPGEAEGNWEYRVLWEQIKTIPISWYRKIHHMYGRIVQDAQIDE